MKTDKFAIMREDGSYVCDPYNSLILWTKEDAEEYIESLMIGHFRLIKVVNRDRRSPIRGS